MDWGLVHIMNGAYFQDVNDSIFSVAGFGPLLLKVLDIIVALTHCKQKYTLKLSAYIV